MAPSPPGRRNRTPDEHVSYYNDDEAANLSTVISHSLADLMGTDVRHAERELYKSIDPASLDHLFRERHDGRPRYDGQTSFAVDGYSVVVTAAGEIRITPTVASD